MNGTSKPTNENKMSNTARKLLSVLLAALMLASIVPVGTLLFISHAITPYKTKQSIVTEQNP